MDIIATRPSFGDFGRVKKGQVLSDVAKTQAEKMIASRAFRMATGADKDAAEKRSKTPIVGAKAKADAKAKAASIDAYDALKAEVEQLRQEAAGSVEKAMEVLGKGLQDFSAEVARKFAEAAEELQRFNGEVKRLSDEHQSLKDEVKLLSGEQKAQKLSGAEGGRK